MAHRRRYAGLIAGGEKFLVEGAVVSRSDLRQRRVSLRAKEDETKTCREFTLGGIGQTSRGYAPNQRQQDSCSSRR